VDRARGRFRSFLLASLDYFLANQWRHAHRQKRGGDTKFISLDAQAASSPSNSSSPANSPARQPSSAYTTRQGQRRACATRTLWPSTRSANTAGSSISRWITSRAETCPNSCAPAVGGQATESVATRPGAAQPLSSELRSWEWRYLWAQTRSDELFTLERREGYVMGASWAPGTGIVAAFGHRGITLWDFANRRRLRGIPHPNSVSALALSPDGKLMAVGSDEEQNRNEIQLCTIAPFPGRFHGDDFHRWNVNGGCWKKFRGRPMSAGRKKTTRSMSSVTRGSPQSMAATLPLTR
jgi:WD40 repeat protein